MGNASRCPAVAVALKNLTCILGLRVSKGLAKGLRLFHTPLLINTRIPYPDHRQHLRQRAGTDSHHRTEEALAITFPRRKSSGRSSGVFDNERPTPTDILFRSTFLGII
jgi:hypothetical protein